MKLAVFGLLLLAAVSTHFYIVLFIGLSFHQNHSTVVRIYWRRLSYLIYPFLGSWPPVCTRP